MKINLIKKSLQAILKSATGWKLENVFLVIFLMFGIFFVAIVPPGWNTDEPDHTYRIYQLSVGNLFSEEVISPMGNRAFGGEVPSGLVDLYKDAGVRDAGASAVDETQKATELLAISPNILRYENNGTYTSINFSGAALYSPVTYALYIPVYLLGKALSLSFFSTLIIARIVGLIATALAFYFAIKHIRIGKWALFVVGLLPTTIIQAASVGADAPLTAISVLFIAYVVNLIFSTNPLRNRHYLILAGLGIILTLIKLAYAPFVLLILAIPIIRRDFNRRSLLTAAIAIAVALIPSIVWTGLVAYIDTNSNLQANFPLQKEFILTEPYTYLKTLYYTFFTPEQAPLEGLFGTAIWGSVSLPAIFTYLAISACLISTAVKDRREIKLMKITRYKNFAWRLSLLFVSIVTAVLIATVLYIYSSTVYQSTIIGLQARYFIPLVPLVLLAVYGNFYKNQKIMKISILILATIILIGTAFIMYHRLYQTLPLLLR